MIKKIVIKNKNNFTNIIFKNKYITKYLESLLKKNKTVFCVADNKVNYLFKKFKGKNNFNLILVKGGESIKNIDLYYQLCNELLKREINREALLVAVGGGTVGDLCGFISSTLLRGLDYKLIPTTLLSQVDSSIGGKNGINTKNGKNLIGTFYHPSEVIIDTEVLKSLPKREIKSGYAEIVKHSLIKDKSFFKWLDKYHHKLLNNDYKLLEKAILKSILIKLWYVKKDPQENLKNFNSRAMLNFGHSFGHALETFYNYKKINHGEAISIGMIIEAKISNKFGFLSDNELNSILDHFIKTKLKISDNNIKNKDILKILMKDKKNLDNKINIVLLKKIGESFFGRNINFTKIKNIINKL